MELITPTLQTYRLQLLGDAMSPEHEMARDFCLATIKEVYGIDYTPDWHADLDSLLLGSGSWFSSGNRGAFYTARDPDGVLVATVGMYDLALKPSTWTRLSNRYSGGEKVCQLVRAYVRKDRRGGGLGTMLADAAETHAKNIGYDVVYLHADAKADRTLKFWASAGYHEFGQVTYPSATGTDTSVDFDKPLGSA